MKKALFIGIPVVLFLLVAVPLYLNNLNQNANSPTSASGSQDSTSTIQGKRPLIYWSDDRHTPHFQGTFQLCNTTQYAGPTVLAIAIVDGDHHVIARQTQTIDTLPIGTCQPIQVMTNPEFYINNPAPGGFTYYIYNGGQNHPIASGTVVKATDPDTQGIAQ